MAAYKSFCELWDSGEIAQADHADGFEILFRVHPPGAGRVTLLFKAESDAQIFEHFASWRAQLGIGSLIITKNYLQNVLIATDEIKRSQVILCWEHL